MSRVEQQPEPLAHLLTACNGLCNRAQRIIISNVKSYAAGRQRLQTATPPAKSLEIACQTEAKLWQELKRFKETGERHVMHYVNGFYTNLLHAVCITCSGSSGEQVQPLNLLSSLRIKAAVLLHPQRESADVRLLRTLLYNLLIRVGDVNRYLKWLLMALPAIVWVRLRNPFLR